jgi:hypothetical protein
MKDSSLLMYKKVERTPPGFPFDKAAISAISGLIPKLAVVALGQKDMPR